jgi:hypothetical protein
LSLLETAGCTRGSLDRGNFELLRVPDEDEIAGWIDDDKRRRDLEQLLAMVRYAGANRCLKAVVHEHFGIEPPAAWSTSGCGSCRHCVELELWLAAALPVSERRPVLDAASAPERLQRGDWVDIQHHGSGQVTRVDQRPTGTRIWVELAETLEARRFDLGAIRWRKL